MAQVVQRAVREVIMVTEALISRTALTTRAAWTVALMP
jgi:hypothetical protein